MLKTKFTVRASREIALNTWELHLTGDTSGIVRPGQFVNIELPGLYLRRPISVCDWGEGSLTLIYKVVGRGTALMAGLKIGEELDILTGLGNGYDTAESGGRPLLIGGGAGVPPLYALAKVLKGEGKSPTAILGFNTREEVFYTEEFSALGVETRVATADGSLGIRGFVTDAMEGLNYSYVYTCGPMPMLRAVYEKMSTSGQFSFEERMGCGFGACMGCSIETKDGSKRICKDGPVLKREEIIW